MGILDNKELWVKLVTLVPREQKEWWVILGQMDSQDSQVQLDGQGRLVNLDNRDRLANVVTTALLEQLEQLEQQVHRVILVEVVT